jgi:alpha-glucoside transport system substrate-binding protein
VKKFIISALALTLAVPAFSAGAAAQAAPGCPAGTWTAATMTKELTDACAGKLAGKTVTMEGPFTDADEVKFNASVKDFEAWTGINIKYTGTKDFEATIRPAVDAGTAPDVVDFPQPGLLKDFARQGKVIDLNTILNADWLKQNYLQSWLDMGTIPGKSGPIMGGIWARFNGKDLVWYPKKAFDAAGYKTPTTWDEMIALSKQIVKDGATPWCIGIESGAATGWAATDWIEAILLRTAPLTTYDNWATPVDPAKRTLFADPAVKAAAQKMADLWFADGFVNGGRKGIVGTNFGDSVKPMFDNPPKCYMHKQGNFITSFFPATAQPGVDYDFFYLPPIDPKFGKPFEVAGDIYGMFNDRPEVRAVMDFFTRGLSLKAWLATGGALAPQKDTNLEWYGSPVEKKIAQLVSDATAVRFDGSDQQPGAVGAGTFWKGMTDYVSGTIDLDTALKEIDASWPTK